MTRFSKQLIFLKMVILPTDLLLGTEVLDVQIRSLTELRLQTIGKIDSISNFLL